MRTHFCPRLMATGPSQCITRSYTSSSLSSMFGMLSSGVATTSPTLCDYTPQHEPAGVLDGAPECRLAHVFSRAPRGKPSKIPEDPKSPASLPQTYPRAVSLPSWAPSIDWELPARLRASAALRRSFQCLSAIFEGYLPNTCLDATVVFPESLSGRGSGKPACLLSNADRKEPPQHWYRQCVAGDGWSGGHTAYYLAACHRGSTLCVPGLTFLSHLHATFSRSLRCSPEWDNKQVRDP